MHRTRQSRAVLLAAALTAALTIACTSVAPPFAIRAAQAEPQACMDALAVGSLEQHPQTGLGIADGDRTMGVEWPFGYSARIDVQGVVLLDETGKVVAREHDRVNVGGGMGGAAPNDVWFACGDVTVESNEGG